MSAGTSSILNFVQVPQPEAAAGIALPVESGGDLSFSNILDEMNVLIGEAVSGETETAGNVLAFPSPSETGTDFEAAENAVSDEIAADISQEAEVETKSVEQSEDTALSTDKTNTVSESILANVDFSEAEPETATLETSSENEIPLELTDVPAENEDSQASDTADSSISQDGDAVDVNQAEDKAEGETTTVSSAQTEEADSDNTQNAQNTGDSVSVDVEISQNLPDMTFASDGQEVLTGTVVHEDVIPSLKSKVTINTENPNTLGSAVSSSAQSVSTDEQAQATVGKNTQSEQAVIASNVKSEVESDTPTIKTSDKVAAAAKENAALQTQDMTVKAKDEAIANLKAAGDMDVTVTESKSGSSSGNSLTQGNASEQVIRMSVENAQQADTSVNNFSLHLDKASSANTSALNQQSAPKDLNKSDIMSQLNFKMDEMQQQGTSKVSIALKPEHLGRIHLEIISSGDGIIARMQTENAQVKELLEKNMETLKSQLGSQGVNVNNIKVEYTNHTSNNAMDFERQQFERDFSQNSGQGKTGGQENQGAYTDGQEILGDAAEFDIEQPKSKIIHDGKVDYKI